MSLRTWKTTRVLASGEAASVFQQLADGSWIELKEGTDPHVSNFRFFPDDTSKGQARVGSVYLAREAGGGGGRIRVELTPTTCLVNNHAFYDGGFDEESGLRAWRTTNVVTGGEMPSLFQELPLLGGSWLEIKDSGESFPFTESSAAGGIMMPNSLVSLTRDGGIRVELTPTSCFVNGNEFYRGECVGSWGGGDGHCLLSQADKENLCKDTHAAVFLFFNGTFSPCHRGHAIVVPRAAFAWRIVARNKRLW